MCREAWQQRWAELRACPDTYYVIVVEDTTVPGGAVVGAATLVREKKFIHSCGNVGRIEVIRAVNREVVAHGQNLNLLEKEMAKIRFGIC